MPHGCSGPPSTLCSSEGSRDMGAPRLGVRRAVVGAGPGWHRADVSAAPPGPDVLWQPTPESSRATRVAAFAEWVADRRRLSFGDPVDYDTLWRWSVEHLDEFWADIAGWSGVLPDVPDDEVLTRREMPGAVWFPGRTLNYAEQAFRYASDDRPALIVVA